MSRSNFRVKVDLSKFYNDARRFCWIFLDGTKVLQIQHMMQHVSKLFSIKVPFHLLLNDAEYLPPTEDVRILKENETVVVVSGTGLDNEAEPLHDESLLPKSLYRFQTPNEAITTVHHKEAQTVEIPVAKVELVTSNQQDISNSMHDASHQDISEIDITFHSVIEDTKTDSANESKATDSNTTEDYSVLDMSLTPVIKPKRVRKRKAKHQKKHQLSQEAPMLITTVKEEETKSKKPKIIGIKKIVGSGKHIRFEADENDDSNISQQPTEDIAANGYVESEPRCSKKLATLLALRHSSTPITFTNKKVKDEVKIENLSDDDTKIVVPTNQVQEINGTVQDERKLTDLDLECVPVMTSKAQVNDIIAFKMLKIAADYTPQVSEFIIAEVISSCPKTSIYTLKIIKGVDQVQVPIGKFSLPEEGEEVTLNDTITINYAQIIQPRLVRQTNAEITISSPI